MEWIQLSSLKTMTEYRGSIPHQVDQKDGG